LWFVVCGLWFAVCGLWFVVQGVMFESVSFLTLKQRGKHNQIPRDCL
jgi:hypothetical protein